MREVLRHSLQEAVIQQSLSPVTHNFNELPGPKQIEGIDEYIGFTVSYGNSLLRFRAVDSYDQNTLSSVSELIEVGYERYSAHELKVKQMQEFNGSCNEGQRIVLVVEEVQARESKVVATVTLQFGMTETLTLISTEEEIKRRLGEESQQFRVVPSDSAKNWNGSIVEVSNLVFTRPIQEEQTVVGIDTTPVSRHESRTKFACQFAGILLLATEIAKRENINMLVAMLKPHLRAGIKRYAGLDLPTAMTEYYIDPTSGSLSRPNTLKRSNIWYILKFYKYFLEEGTTKIDFNIEGEKIDIEKLLTLLEATGEEIDLQITEENYVDLPEIQVTLDNGKSIDLNTLFVRLSHQILNWYKSNKTKAGPVIVGMPVDEFATMLATQIANDNTKRAQAEKEYMEERNEILQLLESEFTADGQVVQRQVFVASMREDRQITIRKLLRRLSEQLKQIGRLNNDEFLLRTSEYGYDIVFTGFPWDNPNHGDSWAISSLQVDGKTILVITSNPWMYEALRQSRNFPVYGHPEVLQDSANSGFSVKGNVDSAIYNISKEMRQRGALQNIARDPNLERLRGSEVLVLGAGTVGQNIAEALARVGVCNIKVFEKPEEDFSVSNTNRIGTATDVGRSKIDTLLSNLNSINPFSKLLGGHGFDHGGEVSESSLREYFEEARNQQALPKAMFLAIDDLPMQAVAHRIAYENKVPLVLITDIGTGAQVQIFDYPKQPLLSNKILDLMSSGDTRVIPELLGGIRPILLEFDLNTVVSFLTGELGIFPQAYAAASIAGAVSIDSLRMLLNREDNPNAKIPKRVYFNPADQLVKVPIIERLRRIGSAIFTASVRKRKKRKANSA